MKNHEIHERHEKRLVRADADRRSRGRVRDGVSLPVPQPRNLKYMRALAEAWLDREIVQRVVAQILTFAGQKAVVLPHPGLDCSGSEIVQAPLAPFLGYACVVGPHREDLAA